MNKNRVLDFVKFNETKINKVKIARIGGEFKNVEDGTVSEYINPYTGNPSNTWYLYDEAVKVFNSIDFKTLLKQEDDVLPEYKMTEEQMEANIAYHYEDDGAKPFIYLFSYDISSDIWNNKERLAKVNGFEDDVMDYITRLTDYKWKLEKSKEIEIPKDVLKKYNLK